MNAYTAVETPELQADKVLGVPQCVVDDDRSVALFVGFFIERLVDLHEMHVGVQFNICSVN